MGPVRVGNLALKQRQNDVYGAVIMATSQFFYDARLISPGDTALFGRLEALGEQAHAVFEAPDAGPWEFRGTEQVHTYSACMCWAACDRLARIASHLGLIDRSELWSSRAAAMKDQILAQSWSDARDSVVNRFGGQDLDATALLLPELGIDERHGPALCGHGRAHRRGIAPGRLSIPLPPCRRLWCSA